MHIVCRAQSWTLSGKCSKKLLDNKSIKQKKCNPPVIIALLNPELFYQKCDEIIDSLLFSWKVELTY
jgi:hypothetical protein